MSSSVTKYVGFAALLFMFCTLCWSLFMMLPAINKFYKANGNREMMDLHPKDNSDEVYEYMTQTTPEARIELKKIYSFQDFIFPMVYGPFILLTLLFFHRKIQGRKKMLFMCISVSLLMVIFDYAENFSILSVIENYPNKINSAENIGLFARLKWAMGISSFLVLTTMLWVLRVKNKHAKQNREENS